MNECFVKLADYFFKANDFFIADHFLGKVPTEDLSSEYQNMKFEAEQEVCGMTTSPNLIIKEISLADVKNYLKVNKISTEIVTFLTETFQQRIDNQFLLLVEYFTEKKHYQIAYNCLLKTSIAIEKQESFWHVKKQIFSNHCNTIFDLELESVFSTNEISLNELIKFCKVKYKYYKNDDFMLYSTVLEFLVEIFYDNKCNVARDQCFAKISKSYELSSKVSGIKLLSLIKNEVATANQNNVSQEIKTCTAEQVRKEKIREVENRFFKPERILLKKRQGFKNLTQKMVGNRLVSAEKQTEDLNFASRSAREFLISYRALSTIFTHYPNPKNNPIWRSNINNQRTKESKDPNNYYKYETKYTNTENIHLGDNEYINCEQHINPNTKRPGNMYVQSAGYYKDMPDIIDEICAKSPIKEKELAKLMVKFAHDSHKIVSADIKKIMEIGSDHQHKCLARKLNKICFLAFIGEPAQWFESSKSELSFEWATLQARTMRLLCEGSLTMKDVFNEDAPYGIFTGTKLLDNIDKIQQKAKNIHLLYDQWKSENRKSTVTAFFEESHSLCNDVSDSKQNIRKDLQYLYGGESDTDGEGYDDDFQNFKMS